VLGYDARIAAAGTEEDIEEKYDATAARYSSSVLTSRGSIKEALVVNSSAVDLTMTGT
jgi:hypothetical protein